MKFNKTCSQTLLPKYVQLYTEHLGKGYVGGLRSHDLDSLVVFLLCKFEVWQERSTLFFFFFGSRRREFQREQNTIRLQAPAPAVVAFLNSTTNRCVLVLLS